MCFNPSKKIILREVTDRVLNWKCRLNIYSGIRSISVLVYVPDAKAGNTSPPPVKQTTQVDAVNLNDDIFHVVSIHP